MPLLRAWSPTQRLAGFVLAALCLGLAALVYGEATAPPAAAPGTATGGAPAAREARAPSPTAPQMPPLQRYSAVTERPLFSPSRQPAPQASSDAQGAWSSFVLAGIVITPDSREALIRHGTPPTIAHLHEGQDLEGWVVRSILPDRVVFAGGDGEHELRLTAKSARSSSADAGRRGPR